MRAPTLEGPTLTLRHPEASDLPYLVRFANDPYLRGWLRFWRPMTEGEELQWLRGVEASDDCVWLMVPHGEREPVGSVGLHDWDRVARHAELGLGILGVQNRGRGWGSEACRLALAHGFGELGLQRAYLHVYADNPAVRLYERLGFRVEGTLRRHGWKRGGWRDQHVMGLLREEWSA